MSATNEDTVSMELSVADCHSLLSVLKRAIEAEKESEQVETEVVETLTLLYEEINRQLEEEEGQGHVNGLYSTNEKA